MSDQTPAVTSEGKPYGLLAEFKDIGDFYRAVGEVKEAGFRKWDAYAPVPVHGADAAMGLGPSKVPWITGVFAAVGLSVAILLQWGTSDVLYPLNIAGKPTDAWEQFTPVMFELTVLFAGSMTIILGGLAVNGLPRFNHPLFESDNFLRVSDDKFFIAIEAKDKKYADARATLERLGAIDIEEIRS